MAIDNALKNPVVTSVLAVKSGDDFVAVGETDKLPVETTQSTTTETVGNSTITSGGVSQVLLTAKTRKGYWVQNKSGASLYINRGGGTASTSNFELVAGGYFETPVWENVSTKIEIIGATTGQAFSYGECV